MQELELQPLSHLRKEHTFCHRKAGNGGKQGIK